MKTFAAIFLTLAVAVPGTWFAARQLGGSPSPAAPASAASGERKVLFYQSAMHPWIKSDKPGRCTICGMELTPVYEGGHAPDAGGDVVSLGQSMIQVLHVETAEAKRRPLTRTLQVSGTIDDDQRRHRVLSAYVDGRIDKLMVNFVGAEVVAGQPLAHLYSPTALLARDSYLLLMRQGGQDQLIGAARERLSRIGLSPEQIARLPEQKNPPNFIEILAPMTGTVVVQNVYEGQYVKEGEKLFEIADFSTMWFQFLAYEQDMPWIALGQEVEVTTPSHPGEVFKGKITFIEPNFDQATRSTKVRVELPNHPPGHEHRLLHRLYADGRMRLETPEVLTVPRTALVQTGPEAVAYVDHGEGAYSRHVVKLGRRGDALVEVLEGLREGDKVVTNSNLLIDSQAEMNRSFSSPAEAPMHDAPDAAKALTDAERGAVEDFTRAADRIAAALSSDDLAAFNRLGPEAMPAVEKLAAVLEARTALGEPLKRLLEARHLHGAKDLAGARKAFHAFSTAATAVLEPLRGAAGVPQFMVWECPMVDEAVPGAPKKARWIQAADRGIANPFFGAEMLTCGVEVKP